jgi:EAL domain-containing protein (putative c-di-GMP-specific phosphodiesterase class I)
MRQPMRMPVTAIPIHGLLIPNSAPSRPRNSFPWRGNRIDRADRPLGDGKRLRTSRRLEKGGIAENGQAIHLPACQFHDESLITDIKSILRKTGLTTELLELELTESMVVQHTGRATKVLQELKKLGVKIALDDFCTGYSPMAQLKNFPIDALKVDRSFIQEIPENRDDGFMAKAIINRDNKSLGLTMVAEPR